MFICKVSLIVFKFPISGNEAADHEPIFARIVSGNPEMSSTCAPEYLTYSVTWGTSQNYSAGGKRTMLSSREEIEMTKADVLVPLQQTFEVMKSTKILS